MISDEGEFSTRTLGVTPVNAESSHDAKFIQQTFMKICSAFGLDLDYIKKHCSIVADSASVNTTTNVIKEGLTTKFGRDLVTPCFCHILGTILKCNLFKNQSNQYPHETLNFKRVYAIIALIQEVVRYVLYFSYSLGSLFNQTNLNGRLEITLKQVHIIRWNGLLRMLKSLMRSWEKVLVILEEKEKHEQRGMLLKEKSLILELIALLEPFEEHTKILEKWNSPTLHLVINSLWGLKHHLKAVSASYTFRERLPNGEVTDVRVEVDSLLIKEVKLMVFTNSDAR